jgi:hypothetical protein
MDFFSFEVFLSFFRFQQFSNKFDIFKILVILK